MASDSPVSMLSLTSQTPEITRASERICCPSSTRKTSPVTSSSPRSSAGFPSRMTVTRGSVVTESFSTVRFARISRITAIRRFGMTTNRKFRLPGLWKTISRTATAAQTMLKKVNRFSAMMRGMLLPVRSFVLLTSPRATFSRTSSEVSPSGAASAGVSVLTCSIESSSYVSDFPRRR